MNNLLRYGLFILVLVASVFLLGLLYWLFYCQCGGPGHPGARPVAFSAPVN
jgi:nitrate reductase NapE component